MNKSSINQHEAKKFNYSHKDWWNPNGVMAPLHSINPMRIEYIKNIIDKFINPNIKTKPIKILDVGCGGGLISISLALNNYDVTALDINQNNIDTVEIEAKNRNIDNIKYVCKTIEEYSENTSIKYDLIICSEVLEHVDNLDIFISAMGNLLTQNGIVIISTINRTFKSYLNAIIGAEYILRWLKIGTHDYSKFIKPSELNNIFSNINYNIFDLQGINFDFENHKWIKTRDVNVNYFASLNKNS